MFFLNCNWMKFQANPTKMRLVIINQTYYVFGDLSEQCCAFGLWLRIIILKLNQKCLHENYISMNYRLTSRLSLMNAGTSLTVFDSEQWKYGLRTITKYGVVDRCPSVYVAHISVHRFGFEDSGYKHPVLLGSRQMARRHATRQRSLTTFILMYTMYYNITFSYIHIKKYRRL